MASSSLLLKLGVKKPIEQTNSPEMTDKILAQVEGLFLAIEIPIKPLLLSSIFLQLNDICHNLLTSNAPFAFDIFNIILKNYIKFLDVDAISHADSRENNNFLRQFFCILCRSDIQELVEQMTMKIRREIFFSLFDQINSSSSIVSYLQNNLSNDNQILIHSCGFILYTVLKVSAILNVKLTSNDLEKYQNNPFNLLIIFIDEYLIKKENLRVNDLLIKEILSFICGITNQTLTIPILINANCPQVCLRWLLSSYLDDYEYQYIIYILNNIARHDEGIIILNKFDCAKTVRQFKNEVLSTNINFIIDKQWRFKISQILDLILASIVDPDELYIEEANNGTIKQILSISKISSKCLGFTYRGFHISEPFIVLMKLCTNDHIIDYILQEDGCLIFFFGILKIFLEKKKIDDDQLGLDVLTILALANIFWSISFHERYQNELIQNIHLIKKLEEFRETDIINHVLPYIFIPSQMSSLRRTLDGIWQNLYPYKFETKSSTKSQTTCSLMISYSHVNIHFCRQLSEMLNKLPELSVNVDINNGKYLWKEISQTLEQSNVVLFLLSKDFYYSKSCRQEFIYVTDILKKKLFFPVFIDPDFKPTGWLHQRIARLKSIRFGERDFITTCEELLTLLNENLFMSISLINNSLEVTKWNDHEIKQWFIKNKIIPELYEFYHFQNGNELLLYAHATLAFVWTKEYERIKLRFEEKFKEQEQSLSPEQFIQFIYALKLLLK